MKKTHISLKAYLETNKDENVHKFAIRGELLEREREKERQKELERGRNIEGQNA